MSNKRWKLMGQRGKINLKMQRRRDPSPATPVRSNGPQRTVKQEQQRVLFPIPQQGREDTKSMPQLGMVTDNLNRQNHWGCNQWFQRQK